MSRIGKKPVELPGGVTATVAGQTVAVKGPKGTREFTATDDVTIAVDGRRDQGDPARHLQARAPAVGHVADPGGEPGDGRDHGLQEGDGDHRRRLSRGGAGQGAEAAARLQPRRRLRDPAEGSASPPRSRPRSWSRASTSRWSARWPPTSASGARPSPTRARASATRASSSSARKARRSEERLMANSKRDVVPEAPSARPEPAAEGGGRPAAAFGAPVEQEHLGPGNRRRRRADARGRLDARGGAGARRARTTRKRRPRSAPRSPRAPRRRASRRCSSTAAASCSTGVSRPWRTPPARPA